MTPFLRHGACETQVRLTLSISCMGKLLGRPTCRVFAVARVGERVVWAYLEGHEVLPAGRRNEPDPGNVFRALDIARDEELWISHPARFFSRQEHPNYPMGGSISTHPMKYMSTTTTTEPQTSPHTTSRATTQPTNTPTTQLERSAAQRLRTTMAAVKLAVTWLGVRKTLAPEQRTTAARAFHADRELLSATRSRVLIP
jgi:hypothetical protein